MLSHCLRRWPNIKAPLVQRTVAAEILYAALVLPVRHSEEKSQIHTAFNAYDDGAPV